MNHHLPAMPPGQPPLPPPRRQHEIHYSTAPPSMRSPTAYMGYHPPHVNGHVLPPYATQQYPQWFASYPQMHPPRHYQPPYAPFIVSSYPHSPHAQPVLAPAQAPPLPVLPLQPRTAASTPLPPALSPPLPPGPAPGPAEQGDRQSSISPLNSVAIASPPPPLTGEPMKTVASPKSTFRVPVPWLSVPESPFPPRTPHRRRKGRLLQSSLLSVELPQKEIQRTETLHCDHADRQLDAKPGEAPAPLPSEPQTPITSHAPSETDSTQPTTPSSAAPTQSVLRTPTQPQSQIKSSKPAVPLMPVVPVLQPSHTPRNLPKESGRPATLTSKFSATPPASEDSLTEASQNGVVGVTVGSSAQTADEPATSVSPPRVTPKSWADLVRSKANPRSTNLGEASGLTISKSEPLVDVLNSLGSDVEQYGEKIAFLEPKGLVNTGNMCYMNSVLQILLYCVPFYQFLDHVGRRAAHSFKSDLPLIDAMILFMKEFRVIDAVRSEEQLRLRLKHNELEEYGTPFIPEFVYQVIRELPRFRDMRRGHQQDAQEFLGFLLEELHEECTRAMKSAFPANADPFIPAESDTTISIDGPSADGWLEVGHKQKPTITRSSGHIALESPVTQIFGGKIRSEFKVPGNKNSVTLEPYQPLQLDIGSPEINNIIDALKGLTRPESIQGDFNSPRGPKVTAIKQIFIETLPPVLILHLKRFQYDSTTRGTQKIWKKIGYPLELEIPREVFPPHKRNAMTIHSDLPKYRLIGVIYHHGKNASGGHYTVDVRRQDGREWIRLDDTVIRRLRSEDVAEAGSEADPKSLAAMLEQHKRDRNPNVNIYEQFDQEDDGHSDNEKGWSQVNGSGSGVHSAKRSAPTNGVASPTTSGASSGKRTPVGRYGARDSKVAYLLFYHRITGP